MFAEIEVFLKGAVKAKESGLYSTMAQQIIEEAPQNGKELFDTIGVHIQDAPDSYNRQAKKIFTAMHKDMDTKKLIGAKKEKKQEPEEKKAISDEETPSRAAETDASESGTPSFNREPERETTESESRQQEGENDAWAAKKAALKIKREQEEQAAIDYEIDSMIKSKEAIPPPRVMHDKDDLDVKDIWLPGVTLIAGSKELLIDATVKLTRGRKYGLIGRNGTGKTTLINAICRKELNNMP